jgi:hypothetical protein
VAADSLLSGGTLRDTRLARALIAHEHPTAAALFALLVLVYLWPALVGGGLLAPTALVWEFTPWNGNPPGTMPYLNSDLGDATSAYYPWNVLAREYVHAGTFPAWNPYALGGTPLWANSQIAWLSPFSVPLWILPVHAGIGVAAALKLWTGGFGAYLLARELRLSFWPAIVAGASFALCAFNVVWLSYGPFVTVAVMLPWALWLVERIVRRGRAGDGLGLAAVLGTALLGGHPGTQVHVLAGAAVYALVRALVVAGVARPERLRRLGLVAIAFALGILLSAVVLIPAALVAVDTYGVERRMGGAPGFRSSSIPFDALRTALFPEWWGRPSEQLSIPGPASYKERTFYAGAVTILLACVALLARGGWRRMAPLVALGALGLAISLRAPMLYEVVIALPGFDRIQNGRILLWFLLAVALLGGFGLQRLLELRGRLGRGWAVPAAALLAAVLATVSLPLDGDVWTEAIDYALSRSDTDDATPAIALASVLWFALFAAALTAIVLLARRRVLRSGVVGGLVALVVALDLLHVAVGYQPIGPAEALVPPRTPAIDFLARRRDEGRIGGLATVRADWFSLYHLRDVRGSDEPRPTLRQARLLDMVDSDGNPIVFSSLSDVGARVLGLLGVRYLLAPPGVGSGGVSGLTPAYEGEDATVFANALALPRVTTPTRVRVAGTEADEFATIADAGFAPPEEALVRADEVGEASLSRASGGSARVVAEDDDSVRLRASLPQAGLVVLNDAWDSGWHVEVDGRPARPLQVDVALRGVVVPAGTHEIAWRYRVPGLRLGAALSIASLLICAGWGASLLRRRRPR